MLAKAELHVHLEGTMPPKLAKQLAEKNKIELPAEIFRDENSYSWSNFDHFQKVYDIVSAVIQTPEDFQCVTYEYLKHCAAEEAIYVELIVSPAHVAESGITYPEVIAGVSAGIAKAKQDFNIESRILLAAVRHLGAEACEQMATLAKKNPHPLVTGFNITGDEVRFPPQLFVKACQIALDAGLCCVCHSGEWCGAASIWDTINLLPVKRLSHGVRAIEDENLIKAIVDRNITLECAPASNIALQVYANYETHPLRKLFDKGVKVTLNSDDPPFFATTLGKEYTNARKYFNFSEQQLRDITRYAIAAGFVEASVKKDLLQSV